MKVICIKQFYLPPDCTYPIKLPVKGNEYEVVDTIEIEGIFCYFLDGFSKYHAFHSEYFAPLHDELDELLKNEIDEINKELSVRKWYTEPLPERKKVTQEFWEF